MGKGDGPPQSSSGHHFGVRAAIRARVPVDWGRAKNISAADMTAYNNRQRQRGQPGAS
jgi:hypothetical protein